MFGEEEDVDGQVEAAMSKIGLDGMDIRCPLAVLLLQNWQVRPLPRGATEGIIDEEKKIVGVDFYGPRVWVRWRLAHEAGHACKLALGIRLPHCEESTDRWARAIVIGRAGMLGKLSSATPDIVRAYADELPEWHIAERIWEVRRSTARRMTG